MPDYIVSVMARDRAGIVAGVSSALYDLGANITTEPDRRARLLHNHPFCVAAGRREIETAPPRRERAAREESCRPSWHPMRRCRPRWPAGRGVHPGRPGARPPGIIARVTGYLAERDQHRVHGQRRRGQLGAHPERSQLPPRSTSPGCRAPSRRWGRSLGYGQPRNMKTSFARRAKCVPSRGCAPPGGKGQGPAALNHALRERDALIRGYPDDCFHAPERAPRRACRHPGDRSLLVRRPRPGDALPPGAGRSCATPGHPGGVPARRGALWHPDRQPAHRAQSGGATCGGA